jgi:uncharacterized protein
MAELWIYAAVCLTTFFAGFIDAVVGGGGLVQVPALLFILPTYNHTSIIATNRAASIAGTSVAAWQYLKKIKVNLTYILVAGTTIAVSSYYGVHLMHKIPKNTFKIILFFIIALLTIYTIFKKQIGQTQKINSNNQKVICLLVLIAIALGLYNGSIGPGTGTLLVFALVRIIGFDFLHASAYAKVINAIADAGSLIGFIASKAIIVKYALPMMVFNVLGGYLGSKVALKKGNGFIRTVFIIVMVILIARLGYDILLK